MRLSGAWLERVNWATQTGKCPVLVWIGSPGRTRTCDQPVNSRLLYQLSYRGTEVLFDKSCILAKLFVE